MWPDIGAATTLKNMKCKELDVEGQQHVYRFMNILQKVLDHTQKKWKFFLWQHNHFI